MLLALFFLLLQGVTNPVVFIIDDAHPATAKIAGYRWVMDGGKAATTKIKVPPPCTDCLTRTYTLGAGTHTLIVTPYTSSGDIVNDAVSYDVLVDVTGDSTETFIYVGLTEKPKGR